jgi:hypothetical protein
LLAAILFEIAGSLCLIYGIMATTTVSSGRDEVHNIGLIASKMLLVFGGLGALAIGALFRITVAVTAATQRNASNP